MTYAILHHFDPVNMYTFTPQNALHIYLKSQDSFAYLFFSVKSLFSSWRLALDSQPNDRVIHQSCICED